MRVLITTRAQFGHFHPLVPYARALQSAGYEVAFACSDPFCAVIESAGFSCRSLGRPAVPPPPASELLRASWNRTNSAGHASIRWGYQNVFAGESVKELAAQLRHVVEQWKPDLIIREQAEFAGAVVADRAVIPHVTAGASSFRSPDWWQDVVGDQLTELWRANGLTVDRPVYELLYRYLDLVSAPPGFRAEQDHQHPVSRFFNAEVFDQTGEEDLPEWLDTLPDRPVVYGTLGTGVFNRFPGVFESIIEGLRSEEITLILTVGREQDPRQFAPHPDNVYIERYIPQSQIFPICDAVITHGGWNTSTAALSHGLPLLVVPLGADQGENALRTEAFGAGRVIWPEERDAETIRKSLNAILTDPGYRSNARRYQRNLQALPGTDAVVELLERLITDHQVD